MIVTNVIVSMGTFLTDPLHRLKVLKVLKTIDSWIKNLIKFRIKRYP